jgi:hypothetical protein
MATSPLPSPVYSAQARAAVPAYLPPAPLPQPPVLPAPVLPDPAAAALPANTAVPAPSFPASAALPPPVAVAPGFGVRAARRRISPISGMALEALGHAIEYLADEYALNAGRLPAIHAHDPQVEAIQILMAANRQVYYDCPVVPHVTERIAGYVSRLLHSVGDVVASFGR